MAAMATTTASILDDARQSRPVGGVAWNWNAFIDESWNGPIIIPATVTAGRAFPRPKVRRLLPALALIAGVAPSAVGAMVAATDDRIVRSFPYTADLKITVRVTVGDVSISAWPRDEVSVEVLRRVPDGTPGEQLPVFIELEDGEIRVDARQPGDGKDAALRADVVLKVPATASLPDVDLFEGRLELEGLRGTVTATVERGPITGRGLSGLLRLETTAGDITLEGAELSSEGLVRCRTFNGGVRVDLARRPSDARILLLTLNGTITSTLPLSERPGFGSRFREATIGAGRYLISIDVVRGDIVLRAPQ
jgi:hypothetical protein